MDDLVRWLGEQLDEDERIAKAAGGTWWAPPDLVGQVHDSGGVNIEAKLRSFAAHIAEHDPARVLREIDAKRDLLRFAEGIHDHHETFTTGVAARLEGTLRRFALAYADRSGYREAWRP